MKRIVKMPSSTPIRNDLFTVEKVQNVQPYWTERFGGYDEAPPNLKEISLEWFTHLFASVFDYVEHRQFAMEGFMVSLTMFHQANGMGFAISARAQFGIKFYSFGGGERGLIKEREEITHGAGG